MSREVTAEAEPAHVEEEKPHTFRTQVEAIEDAISDLRRDGGGSMWIHREDCDGDEAGQVCPCDPVEVFVEAGH